MKAVVVHKSASVDERAWANQFAGGDQLVRNQFPGYNWRGIRVGHPFTIDDLTWNSIVTTVTAAAQAAGSGGVVIIASGHGGAVLDDQGKPDKTHDPFGDGGVINWDPGDLNVDLDWTPQKVRKGLFWDDPVVRYLEPLPIPANPPTRKAEDELRIANKVTNFQIYQKRHDAFEALQKIGQALKASGVARLTFTNCTAGIAPNFMNRLARLCQVEVACFNQKTAVFNDFDLVQRPDPGKSRMVLEKDYSKIVEHGTNTMSARMFSPNLDDNSIAFVGKPGAGVLP
jgi:hypothetical protein